MGYFLPARVTLGVMGFCMFVVGQMIRSNLYIALVQIVEHQKINGTAQNSENWNENTLGLLMGSFYWGYWITEVPGGILAQKFGGKIILTVGTVSSAILNLLFPWAIESHYMIAALIRAGQGLALGLTSPAMHWLAARWIPSIERGKFMTVNHGAAIGSAITLPISGLIIDSLGWELVFYVTAAICLVCSAFWWMLVFDSPEIHPRLRTSEKIFLQENIGGISSKRGENLKTPWKQILLSLPFWGVLIASQGLMWGTVTVNMQTPSYFRQLFQLDIQTIGFFSALPDVCKFVFSLTFSSIIDKCLETKKISITIARKLAMVVCELLPALFLILLGLYASNDPHTALILLTLSCAVGGASASGSAANMVDISPNFASIIVGLIRTLTVVSGVISPLVATYFTRDGISPAEGWRNVWLLTAFVHIVCCTIFLFCGSGQVQPWNNVGEKSSSSKTVELLSLNPDTTSNGKSDFTI